MEEGRKSAREVYNRKSEMRIGGRMFGRWVCTTALREGEVVRAVGRIRREEAYSGLPVRLCPAVP